jgi:hypothetical protein
MSSYLGDERILIRGGTVLTIDAQLGDMEDTDVLVDQEVIVASAMICQTPAHG